MSKGSGGSGFRDLICFNLAMLTKISWRVLNDPSLVLAKISWRVLVLAKMLRDKFFVQPHFCRLMEKTNLLGVGKIFTWWLLLVRGFRWRVGNGSVINAAKDPWIPKPHSFKPMMLHRGMAPKVDMLIDHLSKEWKAQLVSELFEVEFAKLIKAIPSSRSGCDNHQIWHYTNNGVYKVRSGYFGALEM